ncbi:MAG: hypothetical protein K0S46_1174 [Moraxellaceae bacterium]|jgi:hypothetical protein|nr:hypothetical protein [Moraxellaceae bacterium]
MPAGKRNVVGIVVGTMMGLGLAGQAAAGDVYRACADTGNKQVRPSSILVNSLPACTNKEAVHVWNQTGPQGLQGPQGPTGPSAAYVKYGQPLTVLPVTPAGSFPNEAWTDVATLDLPAGSYVITAKASRIVNRSTTEAEVADVKCALNVADGTLATVASEASVGSRRTITLVDTAAFNPTEAKTVKLRCVNRSPVGDVLVGEFYISAIKVGSINWQ